MISIDTCEVFSQYVGAYVEGTLLQEDVYAIEVHLENCSDCRAGVKHYRSIKGLVEYVQLQSDSKKSKASKSSARRKAVSNADSGIVRASEIAQHSDSWPSDDEAAAAPANSNDWYARLGASPWWLVSCALHILVIALTGLVTMAIEMPSNDDSVIMITELQQSQAVTQVHEEPKTDLKDILATKETAATDVKSKEVSDIVVPPDILAKADLGDHFETINPELPDTHSALGNPEARMFHSVQGNTTAAGGGGMSGIGLDDIIGVGGAASAGTGGGWGGGDGTGIGVGTGSGKGSFGNRNGGGRKLMVMRHGGSRATESAVDKALQWLAYHQEPDGHWDANKYGGIGDGDDAPDTGATGLALLAFLGAGHTERIGAYKDNVKRAIDWLIAQEKEDGLIKSHFRKNGYCHAIAGLALAEAGAMSRNKAVLDAAQKAVNNSTAVRQVGDGSEKLGWRYGIKDAPDTSVTGWYIMQMKSAKIAGLHVDPFGFEGATNWLNKVEADKPKADDPYSGGTFGYQSKAAYESMTSVGMLGRLFLGARPDSLGAGVTLLMKHLPEWKENSAHDHPMYYWYYGTLAMFQIGGEEWKKWNEAMKKALLEHQCTAGDDSGSWPLIGREGLRGGKVVCTAFGALTLEVYYRYALLNK
jgi:hypothetical protein